MKKINLLIILAVLQLVSFGQAGNWLWVRSGIGSHISDDWAICTDSNGNIIVAGTYSDSSITFGSFTVYNSHYMQTDIYVAKFDPSGNALWLKSGGGVNNDVPQSICTDINGSVYITGQTPSPTITFGSITLINSSANNMFIVKYDSNGNELWGKNANASTTNGDVGYGVGADPSGNVIISGYYYDTVTFGTTTLISAGGWDAFLIKYDTNGNLLWGKSEGSTGFETSYALNVDGSGNIIMAGVFFSPSVTFGSFTVTNAVSSGSSCDIYVVKYDSLGNVMWAKSGNGNNADYVYSVSSDLSGNIFITGGFNSTTLTFNSSTLNSAGAGGYSAFIIKYDPLGNVIWAKGSGGFGGDWGYSVSPDIDGNVYLVGSFSNSMIFDSDTITPPPIFEDPMYIIKFDTNGNILCWNTLGSGGDDQSGVATDQFGNAYIQGDFGSDATHPFIVGTDTLYNLPGETAFIAKYYCPTSHEGIEERTIKETISIYPNPFSLQTTISFAEEQKNTTIKITNLLGQEIKIINFTGRQLVIDKGEMEAGIYFVRTTDEKKTVTNKKIIIQ